MTLESHLGKSSGAGGSSGKSEHGGGRLRGPRVAAEGTSGEPGWRLTPAEASALPAEGPGGRASGVSSSPLAARPRRSGRALTEEARRSRAPAFRRRLSSSGRARGLWGPGSAALRPGNARLTPLPRAAPPPPAERGRGAQPSGIRPRLAAVPDSPLCGACCARAAQRCHLRPSPAGHPLRAHGMALSPEHGCSQICKAETSHPSSCRQDPASCIYTDSAQFPGQHTSPGLSASPVWHPQEQPWRLQHQDQILFLEIISRSGFILPNGMDVSWHLLPLAEGLLDVYF
ncbi:uncharacterized protein LOC111730324 [Pteropus vampyrus]|uniref:Uncharacterized protein LOC111730324 n=1 Tax=Pteropus vampyrus TaxID=132908 RepID=A0A6P6BQI5_PTEVA|nr:uncharacterized protein LOC111730324 [Pteropus vampyrus]